MYYMIQNAFVRFVKIIQETSFGVWDECTMSHRSHIEAFDRTLKDLKCNNKFMGGITCFR